MRGRGGGSEWVGERLDRFIEGLVVLMICVLFFCIKADRVISLEWSSMVE